MTKSFVEHFIVVNGVVVNHAVAVGDVVEFHVPLGICWGVWQIVSVLSIL